MPCRSTRSLRERSAVCAPAVLLAVLLANIGLQTPAARAEDSADVKKAQILYKKGEAAFNAKHYDEALKEWEAGYALAAKPLFIVNMAHAERRRGELRKALALYRRYLLVDPDTKLRGEVEGVIKELEEAIAAEDAAAPPPTGTPPAVPPPAPAPPVVAAPEPVVVAAPAPAATDEPTPVYKSWWFWSVIGAVVVAGVVTGVVLSSGGTQDQKGTLGSLGKR